MEIMLKGIEKYGKTTTVTKKGAIVRIENLAFHFVISSFIVYPKQIIALDKKEILFDINNQIDNFFATENQRMAFIQEVVTTLSSKDTENSFAFTCLKALKIFNLNTNSI